MENKKINIKREYKEIINYNEQLRSAIAELREQEKNDRYMDAQERIKKYENMTTEQLDEEIKKEKEHQKALAIAELEQKLLVNNLLYIQQHLLFDLLEIYKNKYINKRIGEKTKEKIKEDFEKYILDNYDIETYAYIRTEESYDNREKIKIYLQYKNFYYEYDLSKEEIHYIHGTKEEYLYYYQQAEYIPLKNINKKAIAIIEDYQKNIEKLDTLEKKQAEIIKENNKNIPQLIEKYKIVQSIHYY